MLLIIDNQSSFIKKFKRNFLSDQNIEYRFVDHNEPLVIKEDTPYHEEYFVRAIEHAMPVPLFENSLYVEHVINEELEKMISIRQDPDMTAKQIHTRINRMRID